MARYLSSLDWKVLVFAPLACYAVLGLILGTLFLAVVGDGTSEARHSFATVLLPALLLLPPLAAGYFTARYAARLPQLHVALVALVGAVVCAARVSGPWSVRAAFVAATLGLCGLGAFIRLRGASNRGV